MAANEATCLRLAAACGLPVPEAELLDDERASAWYRRRVLAVLASEALAAMPD